MTLKDNGDGTISDSCTGLVWQQAENAEEMNYEDAVAFCESLTLAGHSNWRLPTKEELVALARVGDKPLREFFPGIQQERYWAFTGRSELAWAESPDRIAYTVDFDPDSGNYCHPTTYFRSYTYLVRAVRAGGEALPTAMTREAEQANAIQSQVSAVCWFCEKNRPADGTPLFYPLVKQEGYERKERTIQIPRCENCEKTHRRVLLLSMWGGMILALPILGLTILAGVLSSESLGGWAWGVAVIVFLTAMAGSIMLFGFILRRLLAWAGTRPEASSKMHPVVKAMTDDGWEKGPVRQEPPKAEPSSPQTQKVQGILVLSRQPMEQPAVLALTQQILDAQKAGGHPVAEGFIAHHMVAGQSVDDQMYTTGAILRVFSSFGEDVLNRIKSFPYHYPDGGSGKFFVLYDRR